MPLDQIPGYDGAKQQWCSVCRASGRLLKCTFACVKCSDRHSIVAVHQRGYTNDVLGKMECILDHAADPDKHARSAIEKKEKEGGASEARGRGVGGRARAGAREPRQRRRKCLWRLCRRRAARPSPVSRTPLRAERAERRGR